MSAVCRRHCDSVAPAASHGTSSSRHHRFLAPTCLLLESSRLQKAVLHAHCGTLHCTWQVIGAITNNKSISTSGSLGALLDINSQCYMSYTLHVSTLADLLMQSAACIAVQHNPTTTLNHNSHTCICCNSTRHSTTEHTCSSSKPSAQCLHGSL